MIQRIDGDLASFFLSTFSFIEDLTSAPNINMNVKLRLLNIEDSENDTELLVRHLTKEGYDVDFRRVESVSEMESALDEDIWDLIVCDYSIPGLSTEIALASLKRRGLDVPFFVISGTIIEEKAVDLMRAGAGDYLMKDNLKRLGPAIARELQEVENRRRKRESEASLEESEQRLKLALAAARMGVWEWNIPAGEIIGSSEFYEIWGDNNLRNIEDFRQVCHSDDVQNLMDRVSEAIESRKHFSVEFRIIKHGEIRYLASTGITEYDHNGSPLRMIGSTRDVTDQKSAEIASRESEQRFHALASSAELVWIADSEGRIPFPELAEDSGASEEAVSGGKFWWLSAIHPDEREATREKWLKCVRTREIYEIENRIQFRDEGYRHYYIRAVPVFNEDGSVREWVGMNIDITKRKQTEEALMASEMKLAQAQKLESVGRLAGGIAHDFNNMLTAINGYSDLALRNAGIDSKLRHYLEEIRKSGERSAALTQQLLAFSRKQVLNPKIVDINEVIAETSSMLSRLIDESIQFESKLSPDLKRVKVDVGQLSQVIMNLIVNARDAMPDGGLLKVETENLEIGRNDPEFFDSEAVHGKYVLLKVSDNGTGMDDNIKKNMFEPFFSTKDVDKGTGLGLSMVYGIVNQSDGFIRVESELGKGSVFKIYFPQVEDEIRPAAARDAQSVSHTGSETVLLVEDEEIVRKLCRQVLETCGFKVIEASNGIEALEIYENQAEEIDILMTDIVMPKMGGKELAERIREISPDMLILFMSGYPNDQGTREGLSEADVNYLQKPFTINTLTEKLKKFLDG